MKDQHKKITGYRDLTEKEIGLMNDIKAAQKATEALHKVIAAHLDGQFEGAPDEEYDRLLNANPFKASLLAEEYLEIGFMMLVKAVAQPER